MLNSKSKRNVLAVAVVLTLAILLALANRWNHNRQNGLPRQLSQTVEGLVYKAAQYNGTAQQDTNPVFALLHANYGIAYMTIARSLASDAVIANLTGIESLALSEQLNAALRASLGALSATAQPQYQPQYQPAQTPVQQLQQLQQQLQQQPPAQPSLQTMPTRPAPTGFSLV